MLERFFLETHKCTKKINKDDLERITIDIRDVSETRYDKVDIAKVNILEIKHSEIQFTCSNIEENNF